MRTFDLRRPSRRRLGVVAVGALVLAGFVAPGAAQAATGGLTPETAVPLALDTVVAADNVGGLDFMDGLTTPGSWPYWGAVVWYSVEVVVPGTLTVETSANTGDPTLEVWTAAGAFVDQDDDSGPGWLNARVSVALPPGTYLVGLGGYNSSEGSVTLSTSFTLGVPTAPRNVGVAPADGAATVTWLPPTAPWSLTGYVLTCSEDGGESYECGTSATTSATLSGLTNGVPYQIWVHAVNANGDSPAAGPVTVVPQVVSSTSVSIAPTAPVSGEEFVVYASAVDASDSSVLTEGTLTVTVDGVPVADVDPGAGFVSAPQTHLAGPMSVVAEYSGTAAVAASTDALSVTVGQIAQAVTIDPLPEDAVFGDVVAPTATSSAGLPITFSAAGACVAEGDPGEQVVRMTDVGECEVTATQEGTAEVAAASDSGSVTVGRAPQELALTGALVDWRYDATQGVAVTSDAGLPVTVEAAGACTLADGVLTPAAVGPCTVTATQEGDEHYLPAAPLEVTVQVLPRLDVVTLSDLPASVRGVLHLPVTATSALGLPVTITGSGACTVAAGEVVMVNVGACTVTGATAGDAVTEAASASATITVMGVPATVFAQVVGAVGDPVEGLGVRGSGSWLRPGSELALTVYSTPRSVGSVTASLEGTAVVGGVLPALEDGTHRLLATGTALDGTPATYEVRFGVEDGVVVWIGTPPLALTGPDLGGALALAALWLTAGLALVAWRRGLTRRELRTV